MVEEVSQVKVVVFEGRKYDVDKSKMASCPYFDVLAVAVFWKNVAKRTVLMKEHTFNIVAIKVQVLVILELFRPQ